MKAPDPIFQSISDEKNFELAWERVRYFDRKDSRDWLGLKIFASNKDHSLQVLREAFLENTFEPSYPETKFLPKKSQTLRPMAILSISDRIIYQAIANIVADKARPLLSMVSNRQSFANVLCEKGSKSMFKPWKEQYKLFQGKFIDLYKEGNTWIVETDLAAFYEMLDHQLLVDFLIQEKLIDEQASYRLTKYLSVWSAVSKGFASNRGLPQGCIASDVLANIFLCQLDRESSCEEYYYIRYVDDIRLLASNVDSARKGLIKIDRRLKKLGLLIQTNKTTIRQVEDLDEEVDKLAYQLSEIEDRIEYLNNIFSALGIDPLKQRQLKDIALNGYLAIGIEDIESIVEESEDIQNSLLDFFWQSKEALDNASDEYAERHLRFCLYRLAGHQSVAYAVIDYLEDRPWLAESICDYLSKCFLDDKILAHLETFISSHEVYDNVVSLALEVLVKRDIFLRKFHGLFRVWLKENRRDWPLLCSIVKALGNSSDNMSILLEVFLSEKYSPLVRRESLIQLIHITSSEEEFTYPILKGIVDRSPIIVDAVLYLIYVESGLNAQSFIEKIDKATVNDYFVIIAKGYDESLPYRRQCYVRHIFRERYYCEIDGNIDFRILFASYYERAIVFLWDAERSFLVNPSRYVSQLDLFHEELVYPLMVDILKLKESHENLSGITFPDRLKIIQKGVPELSTFSSALLRCHALRSQSTEAHTRLHRCLDYTVPIDIRKRDDLKKSLCAAYQELSSYLVAVET